MMKSIAIIPDGNRRLAKRMMEKPWKGHEWGIQKIMNVLEWSKELNIKTVTIYALSLENLEKRPKDELKFLFTLAKKELDTVLTDENHNVNRNKIKLNFFGKLELLPKDLQDSIKKVMEKTKNYNEGTANFAMAYGGRQEILDSINAILKTGVGKVDEKQFRKNLFTNGHDPDLILRTGGEKRLSNFLPYQSVYSELIFLDTFWPDLSKEEFIDAVNSFYSRDRRFGK